ncbi:MAG: ATP-dependent metallopeptidase FtsH/Yme1/Tma family protein [Candidatus Tectomicrobia bacterium]|nr:ATP-dependent metallopeptidase FtsH/Yme1/Tma family protein [Candidatus Tectomicrobia bacterium]
MNQFYRNLALWLVIGLIMIAIFQIFRPRMTESEIGFSEFARAVEEARVLEVMLQGDNVRGRYVNGQYFRTYLPKDHGLIPLLRKKNVNIRVEPPDQGSWYTNLLLSWLPMLLLLGVWIFFMRQMQTGGTKALSFGKSRARLLSDQKKKATFRDVAGVDEAKEELQEIIEFLKDPQKFQRLGGRIPKGVLLMGPPGTGKTLLARAIAGEAGVPFYCISGSDFVEMFVGVGASRVRDLFEQGKKHAPCIIFIDEIDAVGRHRGAGLGGGHDEREQTLNQLLVEMDGFESNEGVILIAATNRPDVLDPALLRPGRFDRRVVVPRPDIKGRLAILQVHARNIPMTQNLELQVVARGTPGFSGADLANLVNEAALYAAGQGKKFVEMQDLEYAKDKVMMGKERRSMVISEDEKRVTAVHEAGHALVSKMIPGTDPVHKVTIIPRGLALGLTHALPVEDRYNRNKEFLLGEIAILMGGRAAERVVLNQESQGAANDIERATLQARKMVCEWGMSERLGPLAFGKEDEMIFLGREIQRHKDYSEKTAEAIDEEIKRIVMECYERAERIVHEQRDKLEAITEALIERETLDGSEVDLLIGGGKLSPLPIRPETKEGESDWRSRRGSEAPSGSAVPGEIPPAPPREQPA